MPDGQEMAHTALHCLLVEASWRTRDGFLQEVWPVLYPILMRASTRRQIPEMTRSIQVVVGFRLSRPTFALPECPRSPWNRAGWLHHFVMRCLLHCWMLS